MKNTLNKHAALFFLALSTPLCWAMDAPTSVSLEHMKAALQDGEGTSSGVKEDNNSIIDKAVDEIFKAGLTQDEIAEVIRYLNIAHYPDKPYVYEPESKKFISEDTSVDEFTIEDALNGNLGINRFDRKANPIDPYKPHFDYTGSKFDNKNVPDIEEIKKMLKERYGEIIAREQKHFDKIPLYHAVAPWNAFLIEIVTRTLSQCHKFEDESGCASKIFRYSNALQFYEDIEVFRNIIFTGLAPLKPDPATCDEECEKNREVIAEHLRKSGMQNDSSLAFKETILSLSPTIFAGHTKPNESAVGFWINSFAAVDGTLKNYKNEIKKFFKIFLNKQGILYKTQEVIDEALSFYEQLFPVPNEGVEARIGGVLFQFFVDPTLVNTMTYISAPFGFKVSKRTIKEDELTTEPSQIFTAIKNNIGNFIELNKEFSYTDPSSYVPSKEPNVLCTEGKDLLCSQVRLLPKHKWMNDPQLVTMHPYFLDEPSIMWQRNFVNAANYISDQVIKILKHKEKVGQKIEENPVEVPFSGEEKDWWDTVSSTIAPLFIKPYPELDELQDMLKTESQMEEKNILSIVEKAKGSNASTEREIEDKKYVVYRPNHGIAHGLRQGFLAGDVIDLFVEAAQQDENYLTLPIAKNMAKWVLGKLQSDPNFKKKVELLASFQRSGRLTDIEDDAGTVRTYYSNRDKEIFTKTVKETPELKDIFTNEEEIDSYAKALTIIPQALLQWGGVTEDEKNLARIITATHYMDLRRQISYTNTLILGNIGDYLFGRKPFVSNEDLDNEQINEDKIVEILWDRSARYLEATGESWLDDPAGRSSYKDIFYKICNDIPRLVETLGHVKEHPLHIPEIIGEPLGIGEDIKEGHSLEIPEDVTVELPKDKDIIKSDTTPVLQTGMGETIIPQKETNND